MILEKMKIKIAATVCLLLVVVLFIFSKWLNGNIDHELKFKKIVNWPKGRIETTYYRIQIPKDFFVLKNADSFQVIVSYPINEYRPNCSNFPSGSPLMYRTDGIMISQQHILDKPDSLDRLIEMQVRIGTLDWMGVSDTIEIAGHRFIGRTGAIVLNEGMKAKSEGKFGIYYDFKEKIWIEVWGDNVESMVKKFKIEFK